MMIKVMVMVMVMMMMMTMTMTTRDAVFFHYVYLYTDMYDFRIYIYMICTSASVKSYQLVKVVSGGRAPGKSSSLASPQLLVIEQFHCFGAVRLEKVQFFYCIDLKKYI